MNTALLIAGLLLWAGAHMLKRIAPGLRRDLGAALGEGVTRALVSVVLLGAVALMVAGYARGGGGQLFAPPPGAHLAANILLLGAIFLFGIGPAGGPLCARIRHPMLWGTVLFGLGHLIVTGSLHAALLFGGLALWALCEMWLINFQDGPWERPRPGDAVRDLKLALASLFAWVVLAGIHWLFGINVFGG